MIVRATAVVYLFCLGHVTRGYVATITTTWLPSLYTGPAQTTNFKHYPCLRCYHWGKINPALQDFILYTFNMLILFKFSANRIVPGCDPCYRVICVRTACMRIYTWPCHTDVIPVFSAGVLVRPPRVAPYRLLT